MPSIDRALEELERRLLTIAKGIQYQEGLASTARGEAAAAEREIASLNEVRDSIIRLIAYAQVEAKKRGERPSSPFSEIGQNVAEGFTRGLGRSLKDIKKVVDGLE